MALDHIPIVIERFKEQRAGNVGQTLANLGVFDEDGICLFDCRILERPWRRNLRNISCIPPEPGGEAIYEWKMLNDSPSFPYAHLWIREVPDRKYIKIHSGNFIVQDGDEDKGDSRGCPIVGEVFEHLNSDGLLDVTNSRPTMRELCRTLKEDMGLTEGKIKISYKIGWKS